MEIRVENRIVLVGIICLYLCYSNGQFRFSSSHFKELKFRKWNLILYTNRFSKVQTIKISTHRMGNTSDFMRGTKFSLEEKSLTRTSQKLPKSRDGQYFLVIFFPYPSLMYPSYIETSRLTKSSIYVKSKSVIFHKKYSGLVVRVIMQLCIESMIHAKKIIC